MCRFGIHIRSVIEKIAGPCLTWCRLGAGSSRRSWSALSWLTRAIVDEFAVQG
ncbi:MAG: hypothetical protein AB7W16_18015 [Candidatus Obscuribacterales bacterium]